MNKTIDYKLKYCAMREIVVEGWGSVCLYQKMNNDKIPWPRPPTILLLKGTYAKTDQYYGTHTIFRGNYLDNGVQVLWFLTHKYRRKMEQFESLRITIQPCVVSPLAAFGGVVNIICSIFKRRSARRTSSKTTLTSNSACSVGATRAYNHVVQETSSQTHRLLRP